MKNKVIKKIIRTISAILAVFMLLNSTVLNVLAFQAQQKQYDDIYNMGSETGGSRKADDPYALMYDGNERFAKRVEDIIDVDFGSQPEMDKSSGIDSNESESEIEREEQKTKLRGYAETGDIEGINDMDISEEMKDQISEIYNITQENRFIVKYKSASGKDISSIMKNNSKGIRIKNKAKKGDTELIVLDEKINPKDFAEELKVLSADSEIEYIQPDFIMSYSTYEDEDVDIITEPGNEENDADDANTNDVDPEEIESTDIEPDNDEALEQVIVAVIDTGIDITHPGLTDYIWSNTDETANDGIDNDGNGYIDDTEGWNFYDDSNTVYDSASLLSSAHGTHIAGIIAAENEDYNVRLMPLRVFGDSGAYTSDIIDAIEYAEANGAKIVNCSFGSTENNTALEEAMENSGMLFVCAAGNARSDLAVTPIFPACFDLNNVISVTSTNSDGGLSYFSNYSANLVDITALGRDVYSTLSNGEYGLYSGTSMSAAQVSGAAAAVLVEQDDLDAGGLKDRLIVTADMLSNLQSTVTGGRQLNLSNAIAGAEQIQVIQNTPADDFDVNGYDPTQDELYELYSNSGDVIQVAEGYSHTLILKENGTVWAWGTNGYGQCGNGATSSTVILTQVIGLSNVVYISAGTNFSLAVKSDGTVWAWGYNFNGRLGDGTTTDRSTPVQVSGLTGVNSVSAGESHGLALKSDGTVRAWGENSVGQLGNGTTTTSYTPVQVNGLTDVICISAGINYSLAVKSNGTVSSWGNNTYGQLGNGSTTEVHAPWPVSSLTGVTNVAAGYYHSLAVKSDGTVWAWGFNLYGQLGNGGYIGSPTPIQTYNLANIISVAAGYCHSLAVRSDGTVWAWGYNYYYALGNDGTNSAAYRTPTQTSDLTDAISVEAGKWCGLAVNSDGTVWGWGWDNYSQTGGGVLGAPTIICSSVPVQLPTNHNLIRGMSYPRKNLAVAEANGSLYAIGGKNTVCSTTVEKYDASTDSWSTLASMTAAREGLGAASADGKIYAVGGNNGTYYYNTTEIYDISSNSWASGINMPTARTDLGVISLNGKIYAIGGSTGSAYLNTVEVYDTFTHTWTEKQGMTTARSDFGIAEIDGIIYVVGGQNSSGALSSVEAYDPVLNSWSTLPGMSMTRYGLGATVIDGKLVVIGGYRGSSYLDTSESYDFSTRTWSLESGILNPRAYFGAVSIADSIYIVGGGNETGNISEPEAYRLGDIAWESKAALPTGRSNLGLASTGGKLYAVGGYMNGYKNTVEEYNPTTNTWTTKAAMSVARKDLGVVAAAVDSNEKVYAIGGYNGTSYLNTVEEYNPGTNAWTARAPMNTARSSFGIAYINGKIYVFGGYNSTGYLDTVEEYDPANNTWTYKADMPSARSEFGVAAIGGKAYAIGGYDGQGCLTTADEYNPASDTWTQKPDMPTARSSLGIVSMNGKAYAIGGYNGSYCYNLVEEYDPTTDTWSARASWPNFIYSFGVAAISGKIYVVGGSPYLNYNKVIEGNFEGSELSQLSTLIHLGENTVNPSGNLSRQYMDLSIESPGFEINISRTYNTGDSRTNGPFGEGWTFGFQGSIEDYGTGKKIVRLPNGSAMTFSVNGSSFTANNSRAALVKNADNTFTLTTKDQYTYDFNTSGKLVSMKDPSGNTISISIDSATGHIDHITYLTDRVIQVTYTGEKITSITDPANRTVNYGYQNNRLVSVTDPMGSVTHYAYDTNGLLNQVSDDGSNIIESMVYDSSSGDGNKRISRLTDVYGNVTGYLYDTEYNKVTATDSNGRYTMKWFDSALYPIVEQDADGRRTTTAYSLDTNGNNKYGEALSVTDRNGNRTIYERDSNGNITKIYNPDSSYKEYGYDSHNNVIRERDEEGKYTFYVYDATGAHLTKKAQPLNGTDQYSGNDTGFSVTNYFYYTDAEAMALGYKAKGLLKTVTDPEGGTTAYTYNADGNMASVTIVRDSENKTTSYTYNQIGWKLTSTKPKGYVTTYVYDSNGRLEKTTLNGGEVTRIVYDNMGRKVKEVSAELYDQLQDNLAGHAYNADVGYRYTYYTSGKVHTMKDPCGNITTYTYDDYGNVETETKPNGGIYKYTYDSLNRLLSISFRENAQATDVILTSYSYLILSNGNTKKTEIKYLNSTGTAVTTTTYDYSGRQIQVEQEDGTSTYTTANTYYDNGTLESSTDENGGTTYYEYDGLNRLIHKWSPVGDGTYAFSSTEYDKAGRVTEISTAKDTVANGIVPTVNLIWTSYEYYEDGSLSQELTSGGSKTTYIYDGDGNVAIKDTYYDTTNCSHVEYAYNYFNKVTEKREEVENQDITGYDNTAAALDLVTAYTYDVNGNLETKTDADGIIITYTYDAMDRLFTTSQPGLDETGAVATITTSKTYDGEGNVLTSTDELGHETTYTYDARGLLTSVEDESDGVYLYAYDRAGRKIAEVTPKNYITNTVLTDLSRTEYTYDDMNRLLRVTQHYYDTEASAWVSFVSKAYTYDGNGNVTMEQNALGYQNSYGTIYEYDKANRLTKTTDPECQLASLDHTYAYTYDALGRVLTQSDANNAVTAYTYDDNGNVLTTTVGGMLTQTNTYDLFGNLLTGTDGNANTTTYTYNNLNLVRSMTMPGDTGIGSLTTTYKYTKLGMVAESINTLGKKQVITYDNQGNILTSTEKKSDNTQVITTGFAYDKVGNLRYQTDGNGNITEYTYDALNRNVTKTVSVTDINSVTTTQTTTLTYDDNGNKLTETDWLGNTNTYTYDALSRLILKVNPYGDTIEGLVYNTNGAQIYSIDARNNIIEYIYDRNGRLTQTIDAEENSTYQYYDGAGNVIETVDGNGNETYYAYDAANRLIEVENALEEITSYTYDDCGNMLTQTDGAGNVTTMYYNCRNLLETRVDDGGVLSGGTIDSTKAESYTYNADGSVNTSTDKNGVTTTYVYDIHSRTLSYTAGSLTVSYTYDDNGNRLTMTDSTGTTTRVFDELNRVISKAVTGVGTATIRYDVTAGMPTGCVGETTADPKGNINTKIFDRAGRIYQAVSGSDTTTFTYYDNGNRSGITYPNGLTAEYTYYDNNKLCSMANKNGGVYLNSFSYQYDGNGNMTSKTEISGTTIYTYDDLNRLETVTEPGGKVTEYTFDEAGNRLSQEVTDGNDVTLISYTYNSQNELTNTVESLNGTPTEEKNYYYDNNGNNISVCVLSGGIETEEAGYDYDVFNQLISAETENDLSEYTYNGEGLRASKAVTTNGITETTRYVYEYDNAVLELDGSGNQTAYNVFAGDMLISRTSGSDTLYYMYNGHGDVMLITDMYGAVVLSYEYDAFGVVTAATGSIENSYLYAGYIFDTETGLYYLNARYYDPVRARFMSADTYYGQRNDLLSLNLYTYCHNEPLMYWDPTGHVDVAVRSSNESQNNEVIWNGDGTITIKTPSGASKMLTMGEDFYIGSDGRAYYTNDSSSAVRAANESAGNNVSWTAGTANDNSTITINGTTVLQEGQDYYIGNDGKAYYYSNVRTINESLGNAVDWLAGATNNTSTISINDSSVLYEGQDYYIGNDGKAHYFDGAPAPGTKKATDNVNGGTAGGSNPAGGTCDNRYGIDTERFLSIAVAEVGYHEKESNYQLNDKYANSGNNNWTKYGEWYGINGGDSAPWCAMFVSWCAEQAGMSTRSSASTGVIMNWYDANDRYQKNDLKTHPHAGDIVIFDKPGTGEEHGHIGIVVAYESNTNLVYTVEGNSGNKVAYRAYDLSHVYNEAIDNKYILVIRGFGMSGGTSYGIITDQMRLATGTLKVS